MGGRREEGTVQASAWGWLRQWAAGVLLAVGFGCAVAGDHLVLLDPSRGHASLGASGESWLDEEGRASIEQVATDAGLRWQPTRDGTIYPLRSGQALWFRFQVAEPDDTARWFLEVPYSGANLVALYARDRHGQWSPRSAGDGLPVAQWPVPHRHPLLPLMLAPGAPHQFYVRVENPHSFGAPIHFVSERQLLRQEQRTALILGMYFGLAGLAMVLSLLAAAGLRDPAFAWYALAVLLMGLAQAAMTGVAGLHLWPTLQWWNDVSSLALPVAAVAALLWFFSSLVSLRERSRALHRALLGVSLACLAAAAAILVVEPSWRFRILIPSIVLGVHAGIGAVLWAAFRGDRHALWLLVGVLPVAVGSTFPLLRTAGLIPVSFWTTYGMQVGIAIELPLLLAVLLKRSQDRRENIRRLLGLGRIDPATGLITGQVFAERLARLIARSERLKHQSVVLLVDIANLEQLRRDFDRRSAEEMPLRVAGRLLTTAREIDSVARLSEHRFGMLVEGPLTPEEAAAVAPRVVARCLMPFKDRPVEWVARVRVAQIQVPCGQDAQQVLDRLEAVLATVPADSKRAVFTIR